MIATCPPNDSLRRYAIGDLDDGLAGEIEQHLVDCPACEETVAQFDSADDTLMRHLPLAAAAAEAADEPGWLDHLRGGPPVGQASRLPVNDSPGPNAEPAASADQFSAYELLGVLGRGGMGVVYRARHRHLNRHVALKVLSPRLTTAAEARRRFEREIQVLGGLHHPGIVMATDAGRAGGAAYLVMELIDGIDLARLVRQSGPLPIAEACEVARQMADALAAAHQTGTVHRDVKPSNVMVDRRGRVKLLDFGLAHLNVLSTDSLETSLGRLLGTLDYMAPEQAGGDEQPGPRADLYGLGATLFYLLTGRPPHGPHTGRSLVGQLRALSSEEAPRISTLRADMPPDLDNFIAGLLSRNPAKRPESAELVAEKLSVWAGGDLAARAADISALPPGGAGGGTADDASAAQQSLYELIGSPHIAEPSRLGHNAKETSGAAQAVKNPAEPAGLSGRGRGRNVVRVAAALAGFGAIFLGIVILIKLRDGSLRIEADADQVEVDKDQITLKQGDKVVVRIGGTLPAADTTATPATVTPGRILENAAEERAKLWPAFVAETDAAAKLDLAERLLKLAEGGPEQRLAHILDVGAEIVRVSYGQQSIHFALRITDEEARNSESWVVEDSNAVRDKFRRLIAQVTEQVTTIPAQATANVMTMAALNRSDAHAAFAIRMLWMAITPINESPEAAQIILARLDVPQTSPDWSAVFLLQRWVFAKHASAEQLKALFTELNDLATQLRKLPAHDLFDRMKGRIHVGLLLLDPAIEIPAELRQTLAAMNFDSIVKKQGYSANLFAGSSGNRSRNPSPYDPTNVNGIRRSTRYMLDESPGALNAFLGQHRSPPFDDATRDVVQALGNLLRVYSDGDEWPVDESARILTDYLRPYFVTGDSELTEQAPTELMPGTAEQLLSHVVHITGEIPDFVRSGRVKSKTIAEETERFARSVDGQATAEDRRFASFRSLGLLDADPYRAVEIALREPATIQPGRGFGRSSGRSSRLSRLEGPTPRPFVPTPAYLLERVSEPSQWGRRWRPQVAGDAAKQGQRGSLVLQVALYDPEIDSLLLLAILTDLTGTNEARDARIATLIAKDETTEAIAGESYFRRDIRTLLASPLQARQHARRMLDEMAAKAKSPALVEAIKEITP